MLSTKTMKNLLVLIDIQKEYVTSGRPYCIKTIAESLENSRSVLNWARSQSDWIIVHVEHRQAGDVFGNNNPLSDFISGFEPLEGERVFRKSDYSSFSNLDFATFVSDPKIDRRVVVGYGSTKCCLATIMDGYSRGQKWTLLSDASRAISEENFSEGNLHDVATQILKSFCEVYDTKSLLKSNLDPEARLNG